MDFSKDPFDVAARSHGVVVDAGRRFFFHVILIKMTASSRQLAAIRGR
jgi:hypothetical protein